MSRPAQSTAKAGERPIFTFDTAMGLCGLSWSKSGIARVFLPGGTVPQAGHPDPPGFVIHAARRIRLHLAGDLQRMDDIPVDLRGLGGFTARVLEAVRRLGPGRTATYAGVAAMAGSPGAARAVGNALARNPVPIIVPCHRVLPSSGGPGGFSGPGGVRTKLLLLALEGVDPWSRDPRRG